jgi:hypothetical protein
MRSDRSAGVAGWVLRTLLVGLIVATCVRVWLGPVTAVPQARAQIPDAGSQRMEMDRELRKANQLLGQILNTLRTQTFKVQMQGTDNTQRKSARSPATGTG